MRHQAFLNIVLSWNFARCVCAQPEAYILVRLLKLILHYINIQITYTNPWEGRNGAFPASLVKNESHFLDAVSSKVLSWLS